MKRIRNAFITGVLVLVPIMATLDIIGWFVRTIEVSVRQYLPTAYLPFDFRGLGLLSGLLFILAAGILTQNYVGRFIVRILDSGVERIAIVGAIYSAIKKFLETVFNPQNDKFKGTVLVEFPRPGVYSIGFRTGSPDPNVARAVPEKLVNVFVPCTPNPTSGFYLLVPESKLVTLDLTVQEAFKIVISMGMVTSDDHLAPKQRS
jgi:uncharacterized membrane protein